MPFCLASTTRTCESSGVGGRSASYQPSIWDFDTIRSLKSEYMVDNVFNCFKDDSGQFKSSLHEDIKGMLSFNDASHLAFEGEDILDEAKYLTTTYLKEIKTPLGTSLSLPKLVSHSLELPLHWRMQRLEARWYIEVCMKEGDIDHDLLKFAILDFNMVQETHQNDLKDMSRWWKDLGLGSHPKLSFAFETKLMECFFWTTGVISDPRFDSLRKWYTKLNTLVTTIDDVYDVYGTLDELTLFCLELRGAVVNLARMAQCIYRTPSDESSEVASSPSLEYSCADDEDLCSRLIGRLLGYFPFET
ncbi:hypothetical protein IFM89_014931 [Coptis chinensis]|uniref:Uncharacterized protein n=1 Tax=Coptis chinensis TaxID=261450 RepID=A0A835H399_9MAGN|nr:hypothetical protein IFM89_014931 [Coptis chinensis]